MPVEIERKFLVTSDEWRDGRPGQRFCQGYLARADGVTVRIRRAGPRGFMTVKGEADGLVRPEFEYEIPVDEAETMLQTLCRRPLIEKTRYEVIYAGQLWEIDEFTGTNEGLVLAEVELERPDQPLTFPPWIGEEVSRDARYRNSELALVPWSGSSPAV